MRIKMIGLRPYYYRDGIWCPMKFWAPYRPVIFINIWERPWTRLERQES